MLEGLEISVISKSNLEFTGRLDSEYYKKSYLLFEKQILRHNSKKLEEIAKFLIGPFGSAFDTENYIEKGPYRYVRGQDVKPFILRDDDNKFLSYDDFERLKKYALKENDLLVSVVGTLGNVCMVQTKDLPAIFSCKSTVIRTIGNSSYVLTYLNCKYGHELLLRKERGAIQKGLNLDDLKTLLIPLFSENFQKIIENFFFSAQDKIEKSKQLYSDAENLFLKELGLNDWKPTKDTAATKTLNDYKISGRLDAEYYQPKYDELFTQLSYFTTKCLGDIVHIVKSIEPGSEAYQKKGIPFIRVANLTKFGISGSDIYLDESYNDENLNPKKDTILLTKDGSVGIAYKVEEDLKIITSGAILHLYIKDKSFKPDYLTLVLNSIIVKMQAERDAGGSIIQHWKPSEIENVVVPKLPENIQESIVSKVQQSFTLKTKSEKLLELAKTAVEIAIEQGEEQAIKLLNNYAQ